LERARPAPLAGISGGNHGSFAIEFCDGRLDRWFVGIEGRLSRENAARFVWPLVVAFPSDYPHSCPVFRFTAVLRHPNVSRAGRVDCAVLERYHPAVSIAALLLGIQELLADPDSAVGQFEPVRKEWTVARVLKCRFNGRPAPRLFAPMEPKEDAPIQIPDYHAAFSTISWKEIRPDEADSSLGILVDSSERGFLE
jgi:ubiquitin-protein ligase